MIGDRLYVALGMASPLMQESTQAGSSPSGASKAVGPKSGVAGSVKLVALQARYHSVPYCTISNTLSIGEVEIRRLPPT